MFWGFYPANLHLSICGDQWIDWEIRCVNKLLRYAGHRPSRIPRSSRCFNVEFWFPLWQTVTFLLITVRPYHKKLHPSVSFLQIKEKRQQSSFLRSHFAQKYIVTFNSNQVVPFGYQKGVFRAKTTRFEDKCIEDQLTHYRVEYF